MSKGRALVLLLAPLAWACGAAPSDPGRDAGAQPDAGLGAGAEIDAGLETDAGTPLPAGVVAFEDTWKAHSWIWNDCSRALRLSGAEPDRGGPYPVAIFLVGTNGEHDYPGIVANVLPALARRGFVAASLEYENGTAFGAAQNCNLYRDNAACMVRHPEDHAGGGHSALARLCARARADCGKGVVFIGHSQGGLTAVQAFAHAPAAPPPGRPLPRLVAAAPLGVGSRGWAAGLQVIDLTACMSAANLPVEPSRLLIVNGESDQFFGGPKGDQAGSQAELEAITGLSCPAPSWDCRRANGSGYLLVRGAQVSSGRAGHEYMSTATVSFGEPHWLSPDRAEPWTLDQVAAWLRAQTLP